ncbi:hypothetical protein JCM4814A_88040 [Streptomyces phaeofaciens JCM 4814]|uniref:DUF732 domain-containing protein n=1 Tax=Streptomyces phaeofaciens TaxID=68254 RepID=A0A918HCG3_9ACTN|nr:hypothetical protein [Streptomyces phaeofaciens]GGT50438.1 hypothetical protein GCM10010226_29390 [Streptomyces phaeofaciens]
MNHRTTAAALASCALAVAALTACGSGEPAASRKEPGTTGKAAAATTPSPGTGATPSAAAGEPGAATTAPSAPRSSSPGSGTDQGQDRDASHGSNASQGSKEEAALPPRPDRDGEAAYVRALTAIDPDIVHDKEDTAVERGRAQCATIHDFPGDREKQIGTALRRFTSPGHPEGFGRVKTTRIVDAVHTNLCPGY